MMINIQTILVTFLVRKKIFVKFYVSQMEVHGYTQTHKHTNSYIYIYTYTYKYRYACISIYTHTYIAIHEVGLRILLYYFFILKSSTLFLETRIMPKSSQYINSNSLLILHLLLNSHPRILGYFFICQSTYYFRHFLKHLDYIEMIKGMNEKRH